jgi:hypothetical protein
VSQHPSHCSSQVLFFKYKCFTPLMDADLQGMREYEAFLR